MENRIVEVKGSVYRPLGIVKKILQDLKEEGLYHPDLMYRGVTVTEEGLDKVRRYGTDRNPEDYDALENSRWDHLYEMDESEEDYERIMEVREELREDYPESFEQSDEFREFDEESMHSPDYVWALPQKGMSICIRTYSETTNSNEFPLIIVYKPEFLESAVPKEIATRFTKEDMMSEDLAIYRFKEGTCANDAFVSGYRIIEIE